jgi:NAD(P)H-nitrite reductase large subunit
MMRYVIVGNGAAGISAAETIRAHDANGEIVVISAENYPMYSRPGLAYVLTGDVPAHQIIARTHDWYADQRIQLKIGIADRLDTTAQQIVLSSGERIAYDRLLIATGAKAVASPYPGGEMEGVVYLDSMDGTRHLLKKLRRAKRAVVIGGGITALEMAEGIARRGVETHYFVRRDRLWSRVFNEQEGNLLARAIEHHGIHIHYNTEITAILGNRRNKVAAVQLQDGSPFACNVVGIAIGVKPYFELVADTVVETDRGILVDEYLESRVPNVFAAGDCAQIYDRWSGKHLSDSLWPSAVASGRAAALNMVGNKTPYIKGVPFNVCMLFGLHVTSIGQVNPRPQEGDGLLQTQHLSRGSSEVWFTFPRSYNSAWSEKGDNSLRLVLDGDKLVGALIVGEQGSADNLRFLIENGADASSLLPHIEDRDALVQGIRLLADQMRQEVASV